MHSMDSVLHGRNIRPATATTRCGNETKGSQISLGVKIDEIRLVCVLV